MLANFIQFPKNAEMKYFTCGKTTDICSQFSLSYQFVLKMILNENFTFDHFLKQTLTNQENEILKKSRDFFCQRDRRQYEFIKMYKDEYKINTNLYCR